MRIASAMRLTGALCFSMVIAAAPSSPSPGKASDLICHTNNAADCYPKIFEPTKDFQVIHDDQDIPPGLHVRMDIYTGKKEARLNIPMEGEEGREDVSTEQAMVIVDQPEPVMAEPEEEPVQNEPVAMRDRQPKKPPAYDNAGKVMPPRPDAEGTISDSTAFQNAVAILTKGDLSGRADVLPTLLDLSHDIYYGVELMKNADVLEQLLWLMYESDWRDTERTVATHKRAAGIVANSIQNNPTALKEAQKSWHQLMPGPHKTSRKELSDNAKWQSDSAMVERMLLLLREETDPAAMKAKIYALTGLMKNADIKDRFLEQEGLGELLSIFRSEFQNKEWDGVRVKLAEFVSDNFLDEDMGAGLGKWPTAISASDKTCAKETKKGEPSDDKCWDYWVGVFRSQCAKKNDEACEEWTSAFLHLMDKAHLPFVEEAMREKSEQRQIRFIKDNKKVGGHDRTRDL